MPIVIKSKKGYSCGFIVKNGPLAIEFILSLRIKLKNDKIYVKIY